jgi:hypothetical protein
MRCESGIHSGVSPAMSISLSITLIDHLGTQ